MSDLNEMDCEEFRGMAAELALGVLTGRERAEALAHLDRCETCRAEVRQLTLTGEELLALMPAIEPPPGFETRVMERIGLTVPGTDQADPKRLARSGKARLRLASRGRRMLALAAVALAAVGAGLGGWGLHAALTSASPATPKDGTTLSSGALVTVGGQHAGQIYLYRGSPEWLYMSVEMTSVKGTVVCQVVGTDGRLSTVGSFTLTNGYGTWGSPVPADVGPLAGARLVSLNGTVLATATFTPR